jgi:hypothetical protein
MCCAPPPFTGGRYYTKTATDSSDSNGRNFCSVPKKKECGIHDDFAVALLHELSERGADSAQLMPELCELKASIWSAMATTGS